MEDKPKLIVDASSIVTQFMHLQDEEFGTDIEYKDKQYHIPDVETSMERLIGSIEKTLETLDLSYEDMIWVLDPKSPGGARKMVLPDYKAGRTERPPLFYRTLKDLHEGALEHVKDNGAIAATPRVSPTVEADDLCNEFCKRFPKTILWAKDKDMLAFPATIHYQDGELNPKKFPVARRHILLYRTLVTGDSSDNLKSCKGFGPKAWENLYELVGDEGIDYLLELMETKNLQELAEDVEAFPKLRLIIDQAEDLYKVFEVMSPAHVPAHKVKWDASIVRKPATLVTADNYHECFDKIVKDLESVDRITMDYETDTCQESKDWATKAGIKVDVIGSEITGMGLRCGDQDYYFCVNHLDTDNIHIDELGAVLMEVSEADVEVLAHNSTGFENIVTYNHFGGILPNVHDTAIMANYVDENDFTSLKHLSKKLLKYQQTSYSETVGEATGMSKITGEGVFSYGVDDVVTTEALFLLFKTIMQYENTWETYKQVEVSCAYTNSMCFITGIHLDYDKIDELEVETDKNIVESEARLKELLLKVGWGDAVFKPIVVFNKAALKLLHEAVTGYELESKARTIKTCMPDIEDEDVLRVCGSWLKDKDSGLEEVNTLYKEYWQPKAELNVGSYVQVGKLLYETLGCPIRYRGIPTDKMKREGRPGTPETGEDAINNAIAFNDTTPEGIELLKELLKLKGYKTRKSLFLDTYRGLVHWKTGKLHCNQRQSAANTRRFQHSKPNLAQLPKKKGKEVRDMITVPEGWSLVALDIDSQELKLQAWASQCPDFLSCYTGEREDRKDVHSMTGLKIALLKNEDYTDYEQFKSLYKEGDDKADQYRGKGKRTNFATSYLCKPYTIAKKECIDEEEAEVFMDGKDKAFPRLLPAIHEFIADASEKRYATTMMGARRHMARLLADRSKKVREKAERQLWSFHIQGSAGEQIRMPMGEAWDKGLIDENFCLPIVTIHDEIVFIVRDDKLESLVPQLYGCVCRKYADMDLEVTSTPEVGKHLGSLKKWEL